MEEREIKFSLEDIRKMLKKFAGATLYPITIDNIIDDFKEVFLKNLRVKIDIHDIKIDCTMTNVEIAPEFIELVQGKKIKPRTYIEWLNQQEDRKDNLGDLVRKFLTDDNIKSWYGFRDNLDKLGATEEEIKTCERSWVEYTTRA